MKVFHLLTQKDKEKGGKRYRQTHRKSLREETEIETSRDKERQRNTLRHKLIFGKKWRDIHRGYRKKWRQRKWWVTYRVQMKREVQKERYKAYLSNRKTSKDIETQKDLEKQRLSVRQRTERKRENQRETGEHCFREGERGSQNER